MKILLIGALGQLGTDLRRTLTGQEIIAVDKEEIDVCDAAAVDGMVDAVAPDILLNCAAFNRVDESVQPGGRKAFNRVDEAEDDPRAAFAVNTLAIRYLAAAARRRDAKLVHFSSDYVFDGPCRRPYVETDLPCPQSMYGVTKLAGEAMVQATWPKHFLIRTCGLYGYTGSRDKGTNFVEAMIGLARRGNPLRVVSDQTYTPTSTLDLAGAVARLIPTEAFGLYHLTNAGECSWFEFAKAIFEAAGLEVKVEPQTSGQLSAKAKRPTYSVLDNYKYRAEGFEDMRHWREALADYMRGRSAAGLS